MKHGSCRYDKKSNILYSKAWYIVSGLKQNVQHQFGLCQGHAWSLDIGERYINLNFLPYLKKKTY